MRFFSCFTSKIVCDQIHLLDKQSGDRGFGLRRGKNASPGQYCKPGWALEGIFHLLRHLALGIAGNVSLTMGFQQKHSFLQVGTNTDNKQLSSECKQGRRKINIWLVENCFIPVPTRIGCSFPIQKKN